MDFVWYAIIIGVVFFALLVIFREVINKYNEEKFFDEMERRLPEVEYTEIVSSSNGSQGSYSSYSTFGGVGGGDYGSRPTTKFLVVYKSGYKHIVHVYDGTHLFNRYVALLKKD